MFRVLLGNNLNWRPGVGAGVNALKGGLYKLTE